VESIVRRFLAELIRWALRPPTQPGFFKLSVVGENAMRKNITVVTFPALADGNPEGVVTRRFLVTTGAGVLHTGDYTVPTSPVTVNLPQGVEVTLSLVDIDQAGNESSPRLFTFTPSDVTPPSQPGDFGLLVTGEVDEA
jgi:hypothetical protein